MRLMPRRRPGIAMSVAPERPLLPTESISVTVTLDEPLDDVTDARVEIGYVNTYKYEWARNTTTNLVGPTSAGGYKDASDWISAGDGPSRASTPSPTASASTS